MKNPKPSLRSIIKPGLYWFSPFIVLILAFLVLHFFDVLYKVGLTGLDPGCDSGGVGFCFSVMVYGMIILLPLGVVCGCIGLIIIALKLLRRHYS